MDPIFVFWVQKKGILSYFPSALVSNQLTQFAHQHSHVCNFIITDSVIWYNNEAHQSALITHSIVREGGSSQCIIAFSWLYCCLFQKSSWKNWLSFFWSCLVKAHSFQQNKPASVFATGVFYLDLFLPNGYCFAYFFNFYDDGTSLTNSWYL